MEKMLKGSGDFSPPDPVECPELCPYCPESRYHKDCPEIECTYEAEAFAFGLNIRAAKLIRSYLPGRGGQDD